LSCEKIRGKGVYSSIRDAILILQNKGMENINLSMAVTAYTLGHEKAGGITDLTIYPNGDLYPCCAMAGKKEFCIGNVYGGVHEHWENKLKNINDLEINECSGCTVLENCMANRCRLFNKVLTGYYNKPSDVICWRENIQHRLRKEIWYK
jgi:uncharacterized protein